MIIVDVYIVLIDIISTQFPGGNREDEDFAQQVAQLAKTEISLMLTNKFEVPDDDDSDMRALFVR